MFQARFPDVPTTDGFLPSLVRRLKAGETRRQYERAALILGAAMRPAPSGWHGTCSNALRAASRFACFSHRVSPAFRRQGAGQTLVKSGLTRIHVIINPGCPPFGKGLLFGLTAGTDKQARVPGQMQFGVSLFPVVSHVRMASGGVSVIHAAAVCDERLFCVHCA